MASFKMPETGTGGQPRSTAWQNGRSGCGRVSLIATLLSISTSGNARQSAARQFDIKRWVACVMLCCLAGHSVAADDKLDANTRDTLRRFVIACVDQRLSLSPLQRQELPVDIELLNLLSDDLKTTVPTAIAVIEAAIFQPDDDSLLSLAVSQTELLSSAQRAVLRHQITPSRQRERVEPDDSRAEARKQIIRDVKAGRIERSRLSERLQQFEERELVVLEQAIESSSDRTLTFYHGLLAAAKRAEDAGETPPEEAAARREGLKQAVFGQLAGHILRYSVSMDEIERIRTEQRQGGISKQEATARLAEIERRDDPNPHREKFADYLALRLQAHRPHLGALSPASLEQVRKIEEHVTTQFLDQLEQTERPLPGPVNPSSDQQEAVLKVKALQADGRISQREAEIRTRAIMALKPRSVFSGRIRRLQAYDPGRDPVYDQAMAGLMTETARTDYREWKESRILFRESAIRDVVQTIVKARLNLTASQSRALQKQLENNNVRPATGVRHEAVLHVFEQVARRIDRNALSSEQKSELIRLQARIAGQSD